MTEPSRPPENLPEAGSVAIVTGGAHGIGREYCAAFVSAGCRVVVADVDAEGARAAARQLGECDALAVSTDVADEASVDALVAAAMERFGRVDALVNNAAVFAAVPLRRVPLEQITVAEWDQVMAVNVRGAFLCARAVAPRMKARGFGRIVNVSSGTFFHGLAWPHYVTSKAAIIGLTRSLARELGPHGITVNAVAPGLTHADTTTAEILANEDANVAARAIHRGETPRDVVGAVLFLASPAAAFITGQTLVVDGGRVMH